jgi:hypothetical protein
VVPEHLVALARRFLADGLRDGYPEEWVGTLDRLAQLDFTHIIMGHGNVSGREWLTTFRSYVHDMVEAVRQEAAAGATLEEVKQRVSTKLAPRYEKPFSTYGGGAAARERDQPLADADRGPEARDPGRRSCCQPVVRASAPLSGAPTARRTRRRSAEDGAAALAREHERRWLTFFFVYHTKR